MKANEIKVNELRVGNILDYYGQNVIVLEIKKNDYIECGYFNDSIGFERKITEKHSPTPITLTEEWLLKFGFNFGICLQDFAKLNHKFVEYKTLNGYFSENFIFYFLNKTEIKYVHQLQNLYFALTGEELTIK